MQTILIRYQRELEKVKEIFESLYEELLVTGNVLLNPNNPTHVAFEKWLNGNGITE